MSAVRNHPGEYVRQTYLSPRGLTVTEAAKLIGISRPGVSNFLNGRVSATEYMASRIEVAFGMPKAELLKMQAEFDARAAASTAEGAREYGRTRLRAGSIATSKPARASQCSCERWSIRRARV